MIISYTLIIFVMLIDNKQARISLYYYNYDLTTYVLWKRIISYLCYPGTPPNAHLLNLVNMLVIVNYAYNR